MHNSDNFASEIVFKVAASKHFNCANASTEDGIRMFESIFKKHLNKKTTIADGSGVSRENLISAKVYMSIFDEILSITDIETLLPNSNQGTLNDRLMFLQGNLKAKTGTLKDCSGLSGRVKSLQNNDYNFVVIVQNYKKRKALIKHFEERIVGTIYKNY